MIQKKKKKSLSRLLECMTQNYKIPGWERRDKLMDIGSGNDFMASTLKSYTWDCTELEQTK